MKNQIVSILGRLQRSLIRVIVGRPARSWGEGVTCTQKHVGPRPTGLRTQRSEAESRVFHSLVRIYGKVLYNAVVEVKEKYIFLADWVGCRGETESSLFKSIVWFEAQHSWKFETCPAFWHYRLWHKSSSDLHPVKCKSYWSNTWAASATSYSASLPSTPLGNAFAWTAQRQASLNKSTVTLINAQTQVI